MEIYFATNSNEMFNNVCDVYNQRRNLTITYIPEDSKRRKLELSNSSNSLTKTLSELRTLSRTCEFKKKI